MSESQSPEPGKKGRPTPPRKLQEEARKKPLVGDRSKEAKAAARQKVREERNKAREGMMAGDERYLTLRDRGPQRRYVRDLVDARFTAGELVLPSLFLVVLATFIDSYTVQLVTLFAMWGLFAVVAIDAWFVSRMVKKRAAKKFGSDKLEGGLGWYGAMRSIQMRSLRIPKPQVARFTKLER
ncbi:DUF3043 domain-containing protein [Aquiluna borgnonia]|uniref:DUF3043 domain-containing protein n=1 Tax=Aquiluna borgnonia TaxID=2499157 RepID=A0A7D4Q465_9MICO|nr:DUF3043 domain-containing protein [Aquiluna borgnonia]QKJ25369.1 DUF3043 domain-containing protein [Aquiluna borgnonia]